MSALDTPDVLASWRGWALAAEGADEPELALRLWSTAPPEVVPAWEAELGRLRTLLALRRFPEAVGRARALAAQVPRTAGDPVDLMVAAAFAAMGDDAAYDYLLAAARAPRLSVPAPQLLRVVAVVAEHRGRMRDAAWAWAALVERLGVTSPAVSTGFAATVIGARPADADAASLLAAVRRASEALDRVDPHPSDDPEPVLASVARLTDRGDAAGARLLLRAVDVTTPGVPALRAATRSVTPVGQVRLRVAVAAVLYLLLIAAVIQLRLVSGDIRVGSGALLGLGVVAWGRTVPLPGLTRAESEVYRVLGRGGRPAGAVIAGVSPAVAGPRQNTGVWGLGGLLGAVAGLVVGIQLTSVGGPLAGVVRGVDGPRVSALVVWAVLVLVVGTLGLFGFREMDLALRRRRSARRAARRREAMSAQAAQCACRARAGRSGAAATDYATGHLTPADGGRRLAEAVPGAQVRRCVATRALWLTGPVGDRDRALALNGMTALR